MFILFDVNETLLDLEALDAPFRDVFGSEEARKTWFGQMLQSAFVTIITDEYRDFSEIGRAALEMTARRYRVELSSEDRDRLLGAMRALPAHDDVGAALGRLQTAGLRLATLSNSTLDTSQAQLVHAGLAPFFEQILSADSVQRLKPAPEPYAYAAAQLGIVPTETFFVAAHAWDVAGAARAGFRTRFPGTPGQSPRPARPSTRPAQQQSARAS